MLTDRIVAASLEKSGLEFIDFVMAEVSEHTNGSFCFLGILKNKAEDIVLGILANEGKSLEQRFEYCMTDQPCRLIYDDQILNIPCDVHLNFKRKVGSGNECFLGFPIKDPVKGVIGHFASYHTLKDQYQAITNDCVKLIQSLLTRELLLLLENHSLREIEDQVDVWRMAALTDQLTKCWNRRALESDWMKYQNGVLAIIDIDHFKKINDTFGHDVGEHCLKVLTSVFSNLCENDRNFVFYRLGGEEFCVVMDGSQKSEMEEFLGKAKQVLASSDKFAGEDIKMTFSGGLADFTSHNDLSSVLKSADQNLYKAKSAGRNRIM